MRFPCAANCLAAANPTPELAPVTRMAPSCCDDAAAEAAAAASAAAARPSSQGLTLVQFSAQLEPCLIQGNTLHTLNTR